VERFLPDYLLLHWEVVRRAAVLAEVVLGVERFLPDYLFLHREVVRRVAALVEQGHPKLEDQH